MSFYEFVKALTDISGNVIDQLESAFCNKTPVNSNLHEILNDLFTRYLIVGGMPEVVDHYRKTLQVTAQDDIYDKILKDYHNDFTQYELSKKLHLIRIYDSIPSFLGKENKRFPGNFLGKGKDFSSMDDDFLWLTNSGVSLLSTKVSEFLVPLVSSLDPTFVKLYFSDVGLLCHLYGNEAKKALLLGDTGFHHGTLYENAVAQELSCMGFPLYYFSQRKHRKIEFAIEKNQTIIPIEVKSGKAYRTHASLDYVLENPRYRLNQGYVFSQNNVSVDGKVTYYPIYLLPFLKDKEDKIIDTHFPDLNILKKA